ncbi:MAG: hypothetical protein MUF87_16405 [Anaerolineae bacterium]|jgi:hypothetical protein|nr:hypothetical protein [Anaerolineae bacterium]
MKLFWFIALTLILINPIKADQDLPEFAMQICPDYDMVELYLEETWEGFVNNVGQSQGLYYETIPSSPEGVQLIGRNTYYSRSGNGVVINGRVLNPDPAKPNNAMRVMALVNQAQVEFEPGVYYYDFVVDAGEEVQFQLNLPPFEDGIHELVVVVLADMHVYPSSHANIYSSGLRIGLIVGETEPQVPVFNYRTSEGFNTNTRPPLDLFISRGQSFIIWGGWRDQVYVPLGEPLNYWFYAGFLAPQEGQIPIDYDYFALMMFQDYRQVPILGEFPAAYFKAARGEANIEFPMRLPPFEETGRHDLMFMRSDNPNVLACHVDPANTNTYDDFRIMRRAFEVIEPY